MLKKEGLGLQFSLKALGSIFSATKKENGNKDKYPKALSIC